MRRILLLLTVAALMAAFLAFGSSGVAFAQDDPAVVADFIPTKKDCKKGGWEDLVGYKNQGECIEAATQDELLEATTVFPTSAYAFGTEITLDGEDYMILDAD